MNSIDPVIADLLDRLAANLQKEFKHRLETLEFKADYPHHLQDAIALVETLRRNLSGLTGVIALQIELDGQTEWLAVTDADYVRQHLADIHAKVIGESDLRVAIEEQYGGCACLTSLG